MKQETWFVLFQGGDTVPTRAQLYFVDQIELSNDSWISAYEIQDLGRIREKRIHQSALLNHRYDFNFRPRFFQNKRDLGNFICGIRLRYDIDIKGLNHLI